MANSNISGGLVARGTVYALVMSTPTLRGATTLAGTTLSATTVRAPTVGASTKMSTVTAVASTKMSAASYNIRMFAFKNPSARTSCTCTGLDAGDIILSLPTYWKFSDGGIRTCGVATSAKVKTTNVASVAGLVSNCTVFIAWAKF